MSIRHLGHPQHFCAAQQCRFRLATSIHDQYVVSTVGEYCPEPHYADEGSDLTEIGHGRLYETYVFTCEPGREDECGCPSITDLNEIDSEGYNDAQSAEQGHAAMVEKWAAKP